MAEKSDSQAAICHGAPKLEVEIKKETLRVAVWERFRKAEDV